ncbi:MAG TPA: hypothetical protein IAC74_06685 [Candidatus Aphodoplasma excrementigallinarum]|uniref:Uncharacterized protein n=1 Tax=Candidatus Aphodoplasma excrementigallinarum TaxID=2840673 RepID=A0A9D1NI05_9FIRM|nr:hypothetical protein [Candidatus Aphodoplasma excrementigallinarum]
MANDMGSTIDALKDLLNSPGAEEKLSSMLGAFLGGDGEEKSAAPADLLSSLMGGGEKKDGGAQDILSGIPVESMLKVAQAYQQISKKDDPRVNLLRAIKPYVRSSRSESVETAIKLLGLLRLAPLLGDLKDVL